eukprot:TRINITY_DN28583_c0_g1_i2.p1 TRINITY_DN28583_c0_g1~~TRINITY_DN28583_c0_g1_i2.p1  ORF type:complete len:582 (+),score=72.32 TRINITY_DN28583_c0_g1_i2:238-1746(+)
MVRARMDWHVLPGVTEEWRSDPLPVKGMRCGGNTFAGTVASGNRGVAAFQYLPHPEENDHHVAAAANKAYVFLDSVVLAVGNSVRRARDGQQKRIVTTLEQARWRGDLTYQLQSEPVETVRFSKIASSEFSIDVPPGKVAWLHQGAVGYVVLGSRVGSKTRVYCGKSTIKATDKQAATDKGWGEARWNDASLDVPFLAAIDHGVHPDNDTYAYAILPNSTTDEVAAQASSIFQGQAMVSVLHNDADAQAVLSGQSLHSVFFQANAAVTVPSVFAGVPLQLISDQPSLVLISKSERHWNFTVAQGTKDGQVDMMCLTLNATGLLGTVEVGYTLPGVSPVASVDKVKVSESPSGTQICFGLPDVEDHVYGQPAMHVGAPVHVEIPVSGEEHIETTTASATTSSNIATTTGSASTMSAWLVVDHYKTTCFNDIGQVKNVSSTHDCRRLCFSYGGKAFNARFLNAILRTCYCLSCSEGEATSNLRYFPPSNGGERWEAHMVEESSK